jgi:hypothetical protein
VAFETFLLIPTAYSYKKGIWVRGERSGEAGEKGKAEGKRQKKDKSKLKTQKKAGVESQPYHHALALLKTQNSKLLSLLPSLLTLHSSLLTLYFLHQRFQPLN